MFGFYLGYILDPNWRGPPTAADGGWAALTARGVGVGAEVPQAAARVPGRRPPASGRIQRGAWLRLPRGLPPPR